jgi:hypothetical protein
VSAKKETTIFGVIKQIYHGRVGNLSHRNIFVQKYMKLNACYPHLITPTLDEIPKRKR